MLKTKATNIFAKLTELKHAMEDMEIICNADRKLHPDGETWQDRAYDKAHSSRILIDGILAEAIDKVINPS